MSLVPVHPEAGADPAQVRWIVPPGLLRLVGRPAAVPAVLAHLWESGLLADIEVEAGAVLLRLGQGRRWAVEGAAVRAALQEALTDPAGWIPASDADGSACARLLAAAEEVCAGAVGDYIRSHAGSIAVLGASADRVSIALGGSCADCPARGWTLATRVESAIRRLYPQLAGVDVRR